MGYSGKNQTGGLRTYFIETPPGIFHFFILPMEIPEKTKLTPWKFHKFLLDPLEISRPKTKTLEIRLYVFLINLENSTSFLINPSRTLKIPHAISLLPLEIPYAQPPFFFFFSGIAQCRYLFTSMMIIMILILKDFWLYWWLIQNYLN